MISGLYSSTCTSQGTIAIYTHVHTYMHILINDDDDDDDDGDEDGKMDIHECSRLLYL